MTTPPELFEVAIPRADVLEGDLAEAVFAARLDEVVDGSAPAVYGDPKTFFESTYPSGGLKSLLNESLGRVSGARPDAPSLVRLETNLGGGKTHNLIALYHAAKGGLDEMRALEFMNPSFLPPEPVEQIAVFVGTEAGATDFPEIRGIKPRTIWGYLALQLGGAEGYETIKDDDENLSAPGADSLGRILGDRPTLILIDELARYLVAASAREGGSIRLDRQVAAFLMALMDAVDSNPRASLVITTTEVTDAFGEQTQAVLDTVTEARAVMARKEHVLRPSEEADLPLILARRLFERLNGAAQDVGRLYGGAASGAADRGADLPDGMTAPSWAEEVGGTYPFHPSTIMVLDRRLSTIPNFQRTRGALRLLARVVRRLWETRPTGTFLIHPHHVDLSDGQIVEEVSSRLDRPKFEVVIRTDIASQAGGAAAHADEIDARMGAPHARRLATTIYLYSLTQGVPGAAAPELIGSVLQPGDDPNVIARALDALEQSAWYLHTDAPGYRFATESSLVKVIQEAEQQVTPTRARHAATDILSGQFRDAGLKVRRVWEDARVPDRADEAFLVILHWDDFGNDRGVDPAVDLPDRIRQLWERAPAGGLREFRNRVVFLAPGRGTHAAMVTAVTRRVALDALISNSATLESLTQEKRTELRDRARESELEARIAVCNHVNLLYVPGKDGLELFELDTVTRASLKPNQTDSIQDRLATMGKTLVAGDAPLDPAWVRSRIGTVLERPLAATEVLQAFARRGDLRMVLDRGQIVSVIVAGVRNGVWEYQDPLRGDEGWGTQQHPNISVRLADDTYLHPPGSAPEVDSRPCPFCGKVHTGPCSTDDGPPPEPSTTFAESGAAGVAVARTIERASEAGRMAVSRIRLAIDELGEETGIELARLQSVIPPSTPNSILRLEVDASVVLDTVDDRLDVRFSGEVDRYQPLRAALDQVLRGHQATLRAALLATFDPPAGLDSEAMQGILRRASDTGPATCKVELSTDGRIEE